MNVVGRVGSFISQGVYSVATPFHPFGGAVDIIVVQQQDGTFRSTPWYVRFGKFQGVLKGAEKIVRINVNGVEANFHMYLDNSGEAYFIREAVPSKESETDVVIGNTDSLKLVQGDSVSDYPTTSEDPTYSRSRLETSFSDSAVVELQDECASPGANQLERADSDAGRKFYEFQDEQSSFEGSVELSEYGSTRYDNLESVENLVESQDSDSEVILFSVDGHVLTAPLSSSEENAENVKLCTPQFHLGPGEGTGLCEGNENFSTSEDPWAVNYIGEHDISKCNSSSENVHNDTGAVGHTSEICEGEKEHVCPSPETQEVMNLEGEVHNDSEDASSSIKREDVFKSCLELSELASRSGPSASNYDSPRNRNMLQESCIEIDSTNKTAHVECMGPVSVFAQSISNDPECKDDQYGMSPQGGGSIPHQHAPEDECCESEIIEPQYATSGEGKQNDTSIGFEISLCGNKLCVGMGSKAAAEAFDAHRMSAEEFKLSAVSVIKNEDLIIRYRERYMRWDKAAPIVLGVAAFGLDLPVEAKDTVPVEEDELQNSADSISDLPTSSSGRRWRLWPIPFRRVKTIEHSNSRSSNEEVFVDSESGSQNSRVESTTVSQSCRDSPRKQLIKTQNPTTEQIATLNLREGQNHITFSFSTRVLGTQQVDAHMYLWMWNTRIVISDVDGTITKSDVLGQFMPLVGRDWSQFGVAQLFSAIKENGYQLLFLSARAIVQAYLTRSFLLNLKQDGKALPNGPVVISPDGLFPSLYREVIRRAPHEFKIACLEDIKALFPADYNPFYAGFGNRDTDELSYRKIGIPKGKIFIINPKGEVAINHRVDVKSYTSLHTLVNDMFPPTSLVEQEDYNSWNFWRTPLPDIDL